MQTRLHTIGWGLPRVALVVAVSVFVATLIAYTTLVFVIVAIQAGNALFP